MGANKSKNLIELPLIEKNIIIHKAFKMNLQLSEVDQFPHGLDGLKLWEAGIILARYIILNVEKFNNKTVLELGSGVGIGGMTADKWTNCSQVVLTDYHPQVLAQIEKNCKKNKCEKSKVELLDWKQHQKLEQNKYDIIMGSDIVYFGCPVKQLYQVFKRCLKSDGIGIIIIPDRKNYAQLFLKQVEDSVFTVEKQKLDRQSYFSSPLQDQQKGKQMYSLLYKVDFYAFVLKKKA